jgi:hypothetical protein
MRKLDTALLRIGLASWAFFALLIAVEAGLLSARFRGAGMFFRWQLWLLAGIFVAALRDLLASTRCRQCREWKVPALRGLFTMGEVICQTCLERTEFDGEKALALDVADGRILL